MAGMFQRFVNNAVRDAVKSHTVNFQPQNTGSFQWLTGYFGTTSTYDLKKFLRAYEDNPLVFEVIDKIKEHVSSLPLKVENERGDEITNPKILELLTPDLKELITISLSSCGNAFVHLVEGVGMGQELDFWYADKVEATVSRATGDVIKYQYTNEVGATITVTDVEKVLHIKNNGSVQIEGTTLKLGLSKLQPMWDIVEGSKERFTAMKSVTKNRGVAGALSNDSEIAMLPKVRQAQQDEFNRNTQGSDKLGSIYVSANRLKYIQFGMTPSDLKLLEGVIEDMRRLASAYQLNSVLFNDVANSKFDNMNEAIAQAYINCYIPTGEKIYGAIFEWLNLIFKTQETVIVDKSQIEVIKATTNVVSQSLKQLSNIAQEYVLAQMSPAQLMELVGTEFENDPVGFKSQSNSKDDEGQSD